MSISRSKTPPHYRYTLNGHILEQVKDNPYLGITISDDLKWSTHTCINKIVNRGSSILGFIRRDLKYCSMSLRETAYISLVRSILEYSAVVWDPHLKKDTDQLEAIQRRAARFVHNDYSKYSSVTQMLRDLKWQPFADRRRDQRLILLYKIANGLVAIPTDSMFEFNTRPARTSHSKSIKVIMCNTDTYKSLFAPATIIHWNKLPNETVLSKSIGHFKAALAAHSD